jgi:WD40 repeat protein
LLCCWLRISRQQGVFCPSFTFRLNLGVRIEVLTNRSHLFVLTPSRKFRTSREGRTESTGIIMVLFFASVSMGVRTATFCTVAAMTRSSRSGQNDLLRRCLPYSLNLCRDSYMTCGLQIAVLDHGGAVHCLCEHKRKLLTGSGDGLLRVFDTSTLKEIAAIPAHDGGVRCLAIQAR